MHRAFPAIVLLLMSLPAAGQGETAYVTDNLRLGIHQATDTSDRAFRTLESGQALEIISRNTNYANVRLPDGVEGYVKAAYLVYEKPAKLIVAESQAESEALRKELEDTKAAFASPAATIDSLEQQLGGSTPEKAARDVERSEGSKKRHAFLDKGEAERDGTRLHRLVDRIELKARD